MGGLGDLSQSLGKILRRTQVLEDTVTEAVASVGARLWPGIGVDAIRVVSFRRGTLQLELDSHARVAEARGFLSETFRNLLNEQLQQDKPRVQSDCARLDLEAGRRHSRDTQSYVSRLNFRVKGTS